MVALSLFCYVFQYMCVLSEFENLPYFFSIFLSGSLSASPSLPLFLSLPPSLTLIVSHLCSLPLSQSYFARYFTECSVLFLCLFIDEAGSGCAHGRHFLEFWLIICLFQQSAHPGLLPQYSGCKASSLQLDHGYVQSVLLFLLHHSPARV